VSGWRKSSLCHLEACVEVRLADDGAQMRDSKDPGPVLRFTPAEWAGFIAGAKAGEFDLPKAAVPA
jgi:hypothetical protein